MSHDVFPAHQGSIRRTDSNSLLRLYDLATEIFHQTRSQAERTRADKAIKRIGAELRSRNVDLSTKMPPANPPGLSSTPP